MGSLQGVGLVQGRLPGFHGVDEVALHLVQIGLGEGAGEEVHRGAADQGALPAGEELDALGGGIRPLVKLPRQGLHRQHSGVLGQGGQGLLVEEVHLGLGEDDFPGPAVGDLVQALDIVANQDADAGQAGHTHLLGEFPGQRLGVAGEGGLLFRVAA